MQQQFQALTGSKLVEAYGLTESSSALGKVLHRKLLEEHT